MTPAMGPVKTIAGTRSDPGDCKRLGLRHFQTDSVCANELARIKHER